jgi:SPP1 family predicted phage head-tail adaptor
MQGLLNNWITPQTVTRTADNVGGYTEAWTSGTAFRGRISVMPANERMTADKLTVYATHRLYCESTVTIDETYRISFDSRTFEIKAVRKPSELSYGGHLEIDLLETT